MKLITKPIKVTSVGMYRLDMLEHPLKAQLPMLVTEVEMDMLVA